MKKISVFASLLILVSLVLGACGTPATPAPPTPNFTSYADHPIDAMTQQGHVSGNPTPLGGPLVAPYSFNVDADGTTGVLTAGSYIYRFSKSPLGYLAVRLPGGQNYTTSPENPVFMGWLEGNFRFSVKQTGDGNSWEIVIYSP